MRPDRFLWRWRERIVAVLLAAAGVAGFALVRHAADSDAQRQSRQRAELVGLQVQSSAVRAAAYVDALRGYLVTHRNVGESDFSSFALGILGLAQLNEAAWVQPVSEAGRARFQAAIGEPITDARGSGLQRAPVRGVYYPAALITQVLAGDVPGVDFGALPPLRRVLESSEALFSVIATAPVNAPGGAGVYFVEAAPRPQARGNVPGFVVVFLPIDWLEGSFANMAGGVEVRVGGGSAGALHAGQSAATQSFATAGSDWSVLVEREGASAAGTALAWSLLGGGLALAVLMLLLGGQRRRADRERRTQLWVLESLDRINRAIQSTSASERTLETALDVVLAIFRCDRAWLVHPGGPQDGSPRVVIERTPPGHAGPVDQGEVLPADATTTSDAIGTVLASGGPVRFDPESEHALPAAPAIRYGVRSMIAMAVYPGPDDPYVFGLHQCSHARVWKPPEEGLFQEIGWRLADALRTELIFTELMQSREALRQLADEQAALRRVATLVAEGAPATRVFDVVAAEMEILVGADWLFLGRYEPGDEVTFVATRGPLASRLPPGTRVTHEGDNVTTIVRRTERPARVEHGQKGEGEIGAIVREVGIRASIGAPMAVNGRLWGVAIASWGAGSPVADAEHRLAQFAQLLETAIGNADSRDQLTASRARLLTAADEARRRMVRDLHDGAQQRLVQTILTLRVAQRTLGVGAPEAEAEAESIVAEALELAERGMAELRELAHGILPTAVTRGGLRAGVQNFVARLDLPVGVDVPADRLPAEIEASAYFIVAEALTNVVKHAQAAHAQVIASVLDHTLRLEVRDDGTGGADPRGHGLVGMGDRVAAIGGRLEIESPPGAGTILTALLPLDGTGGAD
jgi:signal transduction histidine kinase